VDAAYEVPPGLRRAFIVYAELPGKTSSRFFEPIPDSAAEHFDFYWALKCFGKVYTPSHEFPRINLIRTSALNCLALCVKSSTILMKLLDFSESFYKCVSTA
jgi:hypothetical protein